MPDKVVITRPRAQAEPLARAVAALGRDAVVLPLLEIAPLPDQSALKDALARLHEYALVAFVSPNAIDAAFAHIASWPDGVAIAVLGEGSRAALAQHHVRCATIYSPAQGDASDSEHLLRAIDLARLAGQRVLIVRGESGRELMAEGFAAAGAQVVTVASYRRAVPALTAPFAQQLRILLEGANDWIITSSEALRGLVERVRELDPVAGVAKLQQQHLIVPHARIAETAQSLGMPQVTLSGPGDAGVLAALQSRE
ncbi:MAG: uroporphyrinogen-III synthase [Telluria sp.]